MRNGWGFLLKKRFYIPLILLLIVGYGGLHEWRYQHGYCFKEKKYLTSEELADKAMKSIYIKYNKLLTGESVSGTRKLTVNPDRNEKFIAFDSYESFRAASPNCCEPYSFESWESRRIKPKSGRYTRRLDVRFVYKYSPGGNPHARGVVRMDSCGGQARSSF